MTIPDAGGTTFTALGSLVIANLFQIYQSYRANQRAYKARAQEASDRATQAELVAKVADKADHVAQKLDETTTAHTEQLNKIQVTGEKTEKLVNSDLGKILAAHALLARAHAKLTGLPEDNVVANAAENASRVHEGQQVKADQVP